MWPRPIEQRRVESAPGPDTGSRHTDDLAALAPPGLRQATPLPFERALGALHPLERVRLQVHLPEQLRVAAIGPERVEDRMDGQVHQQRVALVEGSVDELEGSVHLREGRVNQATGQRALIGAAVCAALVREQARDVVALAGTGKRHGQRVDRRVRTPAGVDRFPANRWASANLPWNVSA